MTGVAQEWRVCGLPGDGVAADSLVTCALHWPIIGLLTRDLSGRAWLGWGDTSNERLDIVWRCLGDRFVSGPLVHEVGTEAVVVAVGSDGDVLFTGLPDPFGPAAADPEWRPLGLSSRRRPATVSWDPRRIDVFALGDDGRLWQKWLQREDRDWSAGSPGLVVATDVGEMPSAISWGRLRLDLFGRSPDGSIMHKWWDDAADRLDIFTVETASVTTHRYWHPGTGWLPAPLTQWENIGGPLTTPPAAITWGDYHIDIFGRGTDGHLRHLWWSPENGWEPRGRWEDMHGVLGSTPAAIAWGIDRLGVYAISADKTLIYKYRDPGIFWRPSLTRWYECKFADRRVPAAGSLRVCTTPEGLAIVSVVEESLTRAQIGIFAP